MGTFVSAATATASNSVASTVAAGEKVIVCAFGDKLNVSTTSCSDDLGNTYTLIGGLEGSGKVAMFWSDIVNAGSATITYTATEAGSQLIVAALRYTGLATGAPQTFGTADANPGGVGGSDNVIGPTLTPTSAPGTIVASTQKQNNNNLTAGTAFTSRADMATAAGCFVEDANFATTSNIDTRFTTTDTFEGFSVIAAIFGDAVPTAGNIAWIRA